MDIVQWCSLCNKREAHGTLTIEEPGTKALVPLPACIVCVIGLSGETWTEGKMVIKERPDE